MYPYMPPLTAPTHTPPSPPPSGGGPIDRLNVLETQVAMMKEMDGTVIDIEELLRAIRYARSMNYDRIHFTLLRYSRGKS